MFIYDAILESLMCGDNSIQAPELPKKIQNLREVNPTSGKSGFASLFEVSTAHSQPVLSCWRTTGQFIVKASSV